MLTLFSALRLLFLQCGEKRGGLWVALCSRRRWDRKATQRIQRRLTPNGRVKDCDSARGRIKAPTGVLLGQR